MNITGQSQYSKIVSGLRQPGRKFVGQDLNLIFVYPILLPNKLPDLQNVEMIIRNFISTTFLKEIFIQNTISMISLANQIQPLSDEMGIRIDPNATVAQVFQNNQTVGNIPVATRSDTSPNYSVSTQYRDQIQRKINEKTAVIQKVVKTDPVMSKLNPYVEMITMGNLIDVPVIVGTKTFQVDTLSLIHILLAAVATDTKLDSITNLNIICDELNKLDETKYWRLLNKLAAEDKSFHLWSWIKSSGVKVGEKISNKATLHIPETSKFVRTQAKKVGTFASRIQTQRGSLAGDIINPLRGKTGDLSDFAESSAFEILRVMKTNLDQTRLFFRFVLDQKFLKSQVGIEPFDEKSMTKGMTDNLIPDLKRSRILTISGFQDLLAAFGLSALRSSIVAIEPEPDVVGLDLLNIINSEINEKLITSLTQSNEDVFKTISNGMNSATIEATKQQIDVIKNLCNFDIGKEMVDTGNKLADKELPVNFNNQQYVDYAHTLSQLGELSSVKNKQIENLLSQFRDIGTEVVGVLRNEIKTEIAQRLKTIFQTYSQNYTANNVPRVAIVLTTPSNQVTTDQVNRGIIPTTLNYLTEYFYFLYLKALQVAICKLITKVEVTVDTASNDITDWPNYTLVLPIEIVSALHAAMVSKGWESLTTDKEGNYLTSEELSKAGIIHVTENYVKGIVKFVSMKLGVPNFVVVDSKKGDVYYKLMHQSGINKTKLSTLELFVKESINKPIINYY